MLSELIVALPLVMAGFFGFVGSFGLIKLPDPMSRLHAPTKATTLGVGGVLLASIFHSILIEGHLSLHEVLITLFLFLTAPITGLMIAKTNLHLTWRGEDLPDPGEDMHWATYGDSAENSLMDEVEDSDAPKRENHF